MRRRLAALGIAAACGLLPGCGAPALPSSGPVAYRPPVDAYMDALLSGTLHLDDECAWVESEYGDYLPVFPIGIARLDTDELVYGGRYGDGDVIGVGGGDANDYSGAGWYIPDGCPDLPLWAAAPPPDPG
ncbi:hypothetical protein [Microbacterium sulfonylureivorans]|uniref:hypothetical protein n=1 Tax=Microbacterium sulfonylureivorans TaxID=2486854 RepID=UPI000FDC85A4|nr:hypothetical protein [Microbacterium sulfonylureivorans]